MSKTATGNVEAVTADQFGAVWTSEPEFSRRFREYKLGGELLHTFTGAESGHYALAYGMAFDSLGNLWLPYGGTSGGEVDAFYSEGDFLLKFGEFGSGPGQLSGPQGVAIAPDGSIWVTDFGNNRIEKWTPAAQPAVVTGAAKNTLPTGTIMTGYVNPQGVATSYQFEWGTTPALGNVTEEHAIGSGTAPVSVDQGGPALLTPNTTYYYTVKSISEKGVIYGEMRHFTTAAK